MEVLENEQEEETASQNCLCRRAYLVMLILNQVVSMPFLGRERHRYVTCLVLSLELSMALSKLSSRDLLRHQQSNGPRDPEHAQALSKNEA